MNPVIFERQRSLITDHKLNTTTFVKIYRWQSGFSLVFFYNCLAFTPLSNLIGSHDRTAILLIVTMTTYIGNTNTDQTYMETNKSKIFSMPIKLYIYIFITIPDFLHLLVDNGIIRPIVSVHACRIGKVIYTHSFKRIWHPIGWVCSLFLFLLFYLLLLFCHKAYMLNEIVYTNVNNIKTRQSLGR